jgi:hypothetical protein
MGLGRHAQRHRAHAQRARMRKGEEGAVPAVLKAEQA